MIKFDRNYQLTWQTAKPDDEPMVIEPPFSLDFTITRNVLNTANTAVFTLYNSGAAEGKAQYQGYVENQGYIEKQR